MWTPNGKLSYQINKLENNVLVLCNRQDKKIILQTKSSIVCLCAEHKNSRLLVFCSVKIYNSPKYLYGTGY